MKTSDNVLDMLKSKRGLYHAIDAVIAAAIILGVVLSASNFYLHEVSNEDISYVSEDLVRVLSEIGVKEINNSYIKDLLNKSRLSGRNNTLLEEIGMLWAEGNEDLARNITINVIDSLVPSEYSYGIWIDDNLLYGRNQSDVHSISTFRKFISGMERGRPTFGQTGRIYLTGKNNRVTSSFAYFGGFVGEGNITKRIILPQNFTVRNLSLELDAGTDFKLYINGNYSGSFPRGSGNGSEMYPDFWTVNSSYLNNSFVAGVNNITIKFEYINENATASGPKFIGGGYIKVDYNTSDLEDLEVKYFSNESATTKHYLSGIDGFINIYSSFYIPGILRDMKAYIHLDSPYPVYIKIGNTTIFHNSSNQSFYHTISNQTIYSALASNNQDFSDLGLKTIPYRISIENVTKEASPADIVLVTDVSGSMGAEYMDTNGFDRWDGYTLLEEHTVYAASGSYVYLSFNLSDVSFVYDSVGVSAYGLSGCNVDLEVMEPSGSYVRAQYDETSGGVVDTDNDEYFFDDTPQEGEWSIRLLSGCDQNIEVKSYISKIDAARNAGDNFVDNVLASSGPRVGLVNYSSSTRATHELSNDSVSLKNHIDSYTATGGTCICCGINSAVSLLSNSGQQTLISRKTSGWKYNDDDLSSPPSGWTDLTFDDSSWSSGTSVFRNGYSSLGSPRTILTRYAGDYYFRKKFTVDDASRIQDAKLYAVTDNGADIYLNGNLIDGNYGSSGEGSAYYWNRDDIDVPNNYFVDGDNIIAVRLYNQLSCFWIWCWYTDVAFDLELSVSLNSSDAVTRQKAMVVMSDGQANYECSEQGITGDLNNDGLSDTAADDAVQAACDAYNNYNIKVYAVGFGEDADERTLEAIASCGNGDYFNSSSADQLDSIYTRIAEEIIEFTKTQISNVSGISKTKLFSDSYLEFNYTPEVMPLPFGYIPFDIESQRFGNNISSGKLYFPDYAQLSNAVVTSYSSDKWTHNVSVRNMINDSTVYLLSNFGQVYHMLGDAYNVNIPVGYLHPGINNTIITKTSLGPENATPGSRANRIIYQLRIKGFVEPQDVFSKSEGCIWHVEFEDGTSKNITIPSAYNGTAFCNFSVPNATYDPEDAMDDAAFRLFSQLDFDNDGKLAVKIDENKLDIESTTQRGVPSMWGPLFTEIRVWK